MQMVRPETLKILPTLKNLVVNCQPNNLSLDISMIDQCAGARGKYAYALKSIHDTGIPLILSSDAPVSDFNPLAGIYSAVNRKRMDKTPEQGWYPKECLDVHEAVKGYTIGPAAASGLAGRLGSVTAGKLADLVVLDQDIYQIDADELALVKVDKTIFNGRIVYES